MKVLPVFLWVRCNGNVLHDVFVIGYHHRHGPLCVRAAKLEQQIYGFRDFRPEKSREKWR